MDGHIWTRGTPMWECSSLASVQHSTLFFPSMQAQSPGSGHYPLQLDPGLPAGQTTGCENQHKHILQSDSTQGSPRAVSSALCCTPCSPTNWLNTGVPQGCVLSPLMYFLFTCVPFYNINSIIKFADDTTNTGIVVPGQPLPQRQQNKKVLIVDFRKYSSRSTSTGPAVESPTC
jgi:hypothetical protein